MVSVIDRGKGFLAIDREKVFLLSVIDKRKGFLVCVIDRGNGFLV